MSQNSLVMRRHLSAPLAWDRALIKAMGWSKHLKTQTALAKRSGVAQSTIGRILRGEVDPQSGNLLRLARAFGMPLTTLARMAEDAEAGAEPTVVSERVPLISTVHARTFAGSVDTGKPEYIEQWIGCPGENYGPKTFAMRVKGESMEPFYQHGDIIFVDPDVAPAHGNEVVIHHSARNEVTFKRLVLEGERHYIKPLNPDWPEKFVEISAGTGSQIVGVVFGRYSTVPSSAPGRRCNVPN
jgi:SOS-response transcriptional repressor LexA